MHPLGMLGALRRRVLHHIELCRLAAPHNLPAVAEAARVERLYVAAISMICLLAFMISGAWLLIMGVSERR